MRPPVAAWRRLLSPASLFALLVLASAPLTADFSAGYDAAARRQWDIALREFGAAAEAGDAKAQRYLGNMHRLGLGTPRNAEVAAYWYGQAAIRADARARYNLGVMYRDGVGVAQDDALANRWFHAAAANGLAQAQVNLGLRLVEGTGIESDPVRGYAWLHKAAESGNIEARRRRASVASTLSAEQIRSAEALAASQ